MVDAIKQGLRKVVRSGRALAANEVEMSDPFKTKSVADIIVQTVFCHTNFIVIVAEAGI